MRKKIFGVDAYMPMTQTGAMAKSLKTLEKGLVRANSYDQHGRLVLHLHSTEMYSEPRNEIVSANQKALLFVTPVPLAHILFLHIMECSSKRHSTSFMFPP